jgi:glycosyltransferase involved in cell wall biosynthesis
MRVLVVNRYMGLYGGAETVVKELCAHLQQDGVKVRLVTLNISEEVSRMMGSCDIRLPRRQMPYALRSTSVAASLGILTEIRLLRELVKRSAADCDVINAHNFPAEWVCGGLGKPVVWMCNEVPDFYNNPRPSAIMRMLRWAGVKIDAGRVNRDVTTIVCADEYNGSTVRKRYNREPVIIPYGIEYPFFSAAPEAVTITPGKFLLVQAGMVTPEKNQMASIQAVGRLREAIPDISLVLAGRDDTPYARSLKEYVEQERLDDVVTFTGHVSKAKVREYYHACKIALFPVKSQGGWLSPFEALCAGKPIVVSSTMGAASVVKGHGLGVVSDDLATAIKEIYSGYAAYQKQASVARVWVSQNLTWENFSRRFGILLKQAAEQRKAL